MDNLARCAMLAKRDGMSYGHWIAIHGEKQITKKEVIPEGWGQWEYCRKLFRVKKQQRFCEQYCRNKAYSEAHRELIRVKNMNSRERCRARKAAEKNL